MSDTTAPPVFDCRARRHKVITDDRICVLCGARNVVDARQLPQPVQTPPDVAEPLPL